MGLLLNLFLDITKEQHTKKTNNKTLEQEEQMCRRGHTHTKCTHYSTVYNTNVQIMLNLCHSDAL